MSGVGFHRQCHLFGDISPKQRHSGEKSHCHPTALQGAELQDCGIYWDRNRAGTHAPLPPPKAFCLLLIDHLGTNTPSLYFLSEGGHSQRIISFSPLFSQPPKFEAFRVRLEGGDTPEQPCWSHLHHSTEHMHPKTIFRQRANEFVTVWGTIRSPATSITLSIHFSISNCLG